MTIAVGVSQSRYCGLNTLLDMMIRPMLVMLMNAIVMGVMVS